MTERSGERRDHPANEPAPALTAKARSDEWVYNQRQTGAVPLPISEPSPTMLAEGLAKGVPVWMRANAQANAAVRAVVEPAPTITGGHDTGDRQWVNERPATTVACDSRIAPAGHHDSHMKDAIRVTQQEAATLQTFPPDYPWQGSRTKQFEQIGNAVPPMLAEAVLRALLPDVDDQEMAA